MLLKLRDYLQSHPHVSLADLALHFDIPESVVQDMLEQWMRKGRVVAENEFSRACSGKCCACGDSTSCGSSINTLYRWVK